MGKLYLDLFPRPNRSSAPQIQEYLAMTLFCSVASVRYRFELVATAFELVEQLRTFTRKHLFPHAAETSF